MSVRPVVPQPAELRGVAGLLAALALVFAAGCASVPTAPPTVSKAVALPCQTSMPAKPAFPVDRLTGAEDVWAIGTAMWAERLARIAYELELEVKLAECIRPAAPP